MKTDKLRKFLIPNIPYVFIGWAFLKLSTAYRLTAGADFLTKVMGIGQTIGPAFADFAPGLNPVDWLVGIVGAVAFRLFIHMKSKKAKKFRRDEEYGSARWGNEKDIKPFVDPKFEYLCHRIVRLGQNPLLAYTPAFTGPFLFRGGRPKW